MTDETEKPLVPLASFAKNLDPVPAEAPEPVSAAQRLREFEDEHLAGDPRFQGVIERGHGSLFSRLTPEQKEMHASLEKAVADGG